MRIAFYAPLKAPDHPVPSGDRQMARGLIHALEVAGHDVEVVSTLRAYLPDPDDVPALDALRTAAASECKRIAALWQRDGAPDLWFCYHPYYKSPDLIGPDLCHRFGVPWASAEASLSARRAQGIWVETQAAVARAIGGAVVNFGMTARDRAGLEALAPGARIAPLAPFIDVGDVSVAALDGGLLVTVAMMRAGDKMDSYLALAGALALLPDGCGWRLAVAGDGPMADQVRALFPLDRVEWLGAVDAEGVARLLARGAVYVWPGCGEAYGLAYLEAQAAGLPVVAWATAGVPEVVAHGETGLLAAPGDLAGLSMAISQLLTDKGLRLRMGAAARARVLARHSVESAAITLNAGLRQAMGMDDDNDG